MSSRIISGNRTAEDIVRAYYERQNANPAASQPATPAVIPQTPAVQPIGSIVNGVYVFDNHQLVQATTPVYRKFLKESGYADLDSCLKLEVSKGLLKMDQNVSKVALDRGITLNGNIGDYVTNINHSDSRILVQSLGYQVLTTKLMYGLFIPYIKSEASKGNAEAQATLKEMIDTKAEWLEDLVLGKNKLKIGSKETRLNLPKKDGRYDIADVNHYGYPEKVKDSGEHYLWASKGDEKAAIRGRYSGLGLSLDWGPSIAGPGLGVRVAKFFL